MAKLRVYNLKGFKRMVETTNALVDCPLVSECLNNIDGIKKMHSAWGWLSMIEESADGSEEARSQFMTVRIRLNTDHDDDIYS